MPATTVRANSVSGITHYPGGVSVISGGDFFNNARGDLIIRGEGQASEDSARIGPRTVRDEQVAANYAAADDTLIPLSAADLGLKVGVEYFVLFSYRDVTAAHTPRIGMHRDVDGEGSPTINTVEDLVENSFYGLHHFDPDHSGLVLWPSVGDAIHIRAFHTSGPSAVSIDQVYFFEINNAMREDYYADQALGPARGTLDGAFADTSGWAFRSSSLVVKDTQAAPDSRTERLGDTYPFATDWDYSVYVQARMVGLDPTSIKTVKNGVDLDTIALPTSHSWAIIHMESFWQSYVDTVDIFAWGGEAHIEGFYFRRGSPPKPTVTLQKGSDAGATRTPIACGTTLDTPDDDYDPGGDPGGLEFIATDHAPGDDNPAECRVEARMIGSAGGFSWPYNGAWQDVITVTGTADDGGQEVFLYPGGGSEPNTETMTWEARSYTFASAKRGEASEPASCVFTARKLIGGLDVPAKGIVIAFDNNTHEMGQSWTRLDRGEE